jgi:hypothetical protein
MGKEGYTMAYNGMLLNLSRNVVFIGFYDHVNQRQLGKIINLARQGQSFKPDNVTAAMLLYLLNRTDMDAINFDTLRNLVMAKTGFSSADAESRLNQFLDLLRNLDLLVTVNAGTSHGTTDPDPEKLFDQNQEQGKWTWTDPTLTQSNPTKLRGRNTHYGHGYYLITHRR